MSRTLLKLAAIFLAVIVLAAVLVTAMSHARLKGQLLHCQNNLRYMGQLLDGYYQSEEPIPERGRKFWHALRVNLGYEKQHPEAFVCPVSGRVHPDAASVDGIDYRGPAKDPKELRAEDPVAADRVGSHGDEPGWILLHNHRMEKDSMKILIDATVWNRAAETTTD